MNAENGKKLLLTLGFIAAVLLMARLARGLGSRILRGRRDHRVAFWYRQAVNLGIAVVLLLGLAFALRKVVTALAGDFVILRGKTSTSATAPRWAGSAAT